jgi:hypothetical protein
MWLGITAKTLFYSKILYFMHYVSAYGKSPITPPNCKNVANSQKFKRDQNLWPSGMNLDGIFSQHMHPANTSMSPGQSWHYLSGAARDQLGAQPT